MFTLAEGVDWLRRAKLVQSMDVALATLADLQARSPHPRGQRCCLLFSGLMAATVPASLLSECTRPGNRSFADDLLIRLCTVAGTHNSQIAWTLRLSAQPLTVPMVPAEGAPAVRRGRQRRGPQRRGRRAGRRPADRRPRRAGGDRGDRAPAGALSGFCNRALLISCSR